MNASSKHDRGSPTASEVVKGKPGAVVIGGLFSLAFLGAALTLQALGSSILKLPPQWLAAAVVPVLVGLLVSGYIQKVSFGSVAIEAPSLKPGPYIKPGEPDSSSTASAARPDWTNYRQQEYERHHWLELVHRYRPSTKPGQDYDISIYITKHISGGSLSDQTKGFTDIDYVEFYFGSGWGDRIFKIPNNGDVISINTSSWGSPFLAICRVTFKNHTERVLLQRYIDYEMAPAQQG